MPFSTEKVVPAVLTQARAGRRAAVRFSIRRRRSTFRVLPVFLLLSILSPAAAAAEIQIEPKVGFHGVFQLGRPFPLEVNLANIGRPADGILEIQVWKGGATQGGVPYPTFHRREVFLPARSRRTVQFTIDPDFLSRPLKIQFTSSAATASRELDLRRHFSPAPVVLSVSEGSAVPLISLGASLTNRVVALTLAELPPEPRALLGVSHLILYDQSLRDLSRAQLLALDDWLAAGGRMVIIGSLNFTLYQEPQLGRYLPVRVTGVKRIAFVPHGEAGKGKAIADVWAQTATVLRGKIVTKSQGLPVLVENDWGKGKVVYLALDAGRPPLSTWNGLPKFLQNLLTPAVGENLSLRPQWSEAIFSQLLLSPSFISSYIPTGSLFFATIGYLAGVFVLSWLWQRRHITQRTMALSCCGWILCTAAAGYLFFSRGGQVPDGVLLAATVMENAGDGYVEAQTNLALFSTQLREYSLAFGRGWMDLMPLAAPAYAQPGQSLVYRHGGGATRVQLPLKEWGFKLLRARYLERLPLSAAIERQGEQLLLKVQNQSGKDLTDCWLVAPGTRIALGDLPKGESWTKAFPLGGAAGGDNAEQNRGRGADEVSLREMTFNDKTRDILFHASFFPRDGAEAPWRSGAALFFGWVRDPEPRVEIDDPRIRVHNYALYRAIVPLAGAEEE
ncbi:MAG TPA: hypothetical protein VGB27_10710 [Candidatus Binatia bacterium]